MEKGSSGTGKGKYSCQMQDNAAKKTICYAIQTKQQQQLGIQQQQWLQQQQKNNKSYSSNQL